MKFEKLIRKLNSRKRTLLAILVDPDKYNPELIRLADHSRASCILVGGSRLRKANLGKTVAHIRKISHLPVVLFPGDESQLSPRAHGLLLPSLLSGRNPDYLIGKHVMMAPRIRKMKLHYIPFAYMLVGKGKGSSTQKVTGTSTLNPGKLNYIVHTAMAAEQLGFKAVYLEAGSGADEPVPAKIIREVKKVLEIPVITGGGINSARRAEAAIAAGADMIVVGNALEKNTALLAEIGRCFK